MVRGPEFRIGGGLSFIITRCGHSINYVPLREGLSLSVSQSLHFKNEDCNNLLAQWLWCQVTAPHMAPAAVTVNTSVTVLVAGCFLRIGSYLGFGSLLGYSFHPFKVHDTF